MINYLPDQILQLLTHLVVFDHLLSHHDHSSYSEVEKGL
jgi:hypothetical protein